MVKRVNRGKLSERTAPPKRRNLKEAESYGWVVEDWEAKEAYEFAIDSGWWDEAQLDSDIVRCLNDETLAACLAYIFRNNDFRPWQDREDGEDEFEESAYAGRKSNRTMNEEVVRNSVTLGDIDLHPLRLDGFKSYYSSEDGYQDFTKNCGDFTIYIIDSDEPEPATIYIHPKRGVEYDLNELDREIGDIVIRDQADMDELERRLSELSGGYSESLRSSRRMTESYINLGTIDSTRGLRGYSKEYNSEDGYMMFDKKCGDFRISLVNTDDDPSGTTSVTVFSNMNQGTLDRELGSVVITSVDDLNELESRLLNMSGGRVRESCNVRRKKRARRSRR